MLERMLRAYEEAILDTDPERAHAVVQGALEAGVSPEEAVFQIVIPSLDRMLQAAVTGQDGSIAQHFMAAQISEEVVEAMLPRFARTPSIPGTVVIGTSVGDFHGLGKRIVGGCLRSNLVEVVDLGLNVAPERFVDEALAHGAQVVAISSMMVHTARGERGCRAVRRILKERGLEDRIKVIVGGAPYRFDPHLHQAVQADGWAPNAIEAVPATLELIRKAVRP